MSEEEAKAIYRLNFHKEGAGIGSGMIIVNKADVETVLNILEEKDKEIEKLELFEKMSAEIISNSILKQKIQDKIDEINKAYEDSKNENGETEFYYPNYAIEILQELLEDKESEDKDE